MRISETLLGIDIGTSGLKASVFDRAGNLLAQAYRASEYLPLPAGQMEQRPEQWWQNLCSALREIFSDGQIEPESIAAVGICGFQHCPVFLKEDGQPAADVILLQDERLAASRQDLQQTGALQRIEALTRSMVGAGHFPPIFHFAASHSPQQMEDTRWVLLAKDYLRFRLTGEIATEICDATGTNLIEAAQETWSKALCDILAVPMKVLPSIGLSAAVAGEVTQTAAEQTGLPVGTPVVYGGGDSHCALLGLGCIQSGDTGLLLGTNSTLRTVFTEFAWHPQIKLWGQHHVVPGLYTISASSMAGASVLNWFKQVFVPKQSDSTETFSELENAAGKISIGSDGLLFLPYIYGERCPFYDPQASGAFLGIRHNHTKAHFIRAVLEGVAVNIANCFDLIGDCLGASDVDISCLRLAGGGSRMGLWHQIIADCLELPIQVMSTQEAGTLGAALLGGIGVGLYADFQQAISSSVRLQNVIESDQANVPDYREFRKHFNNPYRRND